LRKNKKAKKAIPFFLGVLLVISILAVLMTQEFSAPNSIIFQDNFETNDFAHWTQHGNSIITTDNPKDGTYCMRTLGGDNGNDANNGYCDKEFDANYTTLYALEYVKIREYPYSQDTNNFLFFLNKGTVFTYIAAVGLYNDNGNFKWSLGYANNGWGHSVKTTASMNPTLGVWYALELRLTCGRGSAEYQVWLNGAELIDLHVTGADSVISAANYLEIGDSLFMQDYDKIIISNQYIIPQISTT
jgi:hypothetical protein